MPKDLVESFSGVRGIWGKGLNKELAQKYAVSYSRLLSEKLGRKLRLIIGYDTRPSSKEIAQIFRDGFSFDAIEIIDVGMLAKTAVELGVRTYKLDGGVMITASHSPKEFNGWELLDNTGAIISPDFLEKVIQMREKIKVPKPPTSFETKIVEEKRQDLKNRYIDFAKKIIGKKGLEAIKKRLFKIVVDPNGGSAVSLIKQFCESLEVEGYYLNMEAGKFARKIEPDFESLNYLKDVIKKQGADFGIGFDCDADRAEIVLPDGSMVNGQYILAISVEEILAELENPRDRVVTTNDCTSALVKKIAEKYSAKVEEVEISEINVVNKMYQENSPIGGEGSASGAIFPPSRCRDGFLSLAIILRYLAKKQKTLTEALKEFPDFYSARDKLHCPAEKQIEVRQNIKNYLLEHNFKIQERGGETGTVKALIEPDSFIFFRASKTEPGTFRVISDAPDKKLAQDLLEQGIKIFNYAKAKS